MLRKIRLNRSFFERPTLTVAKDLLGKVVVHKVKLISTDFIHGLGTDKAKQINTVRGRIIETEAYIGVEDKACHARYGKTKRNEVMWGPAGHSYVYLCMGLHHLLNIVTEQTDKPAAVLIRKIEPLSGRNDVLKSYGPGNLTKYLKIDRNLSNIDITKSKELWIEDDGFQVSDKMVERKPRVGIEYAGDDAKLLWRFILRK